MRAGSGTISSIVDCLAFSLAPALVLYYGRYSIAGRGLG